MREGGVLVAEMETICARLALLTRAAWKEGLPPPMKRATLQQMLRLGAISGLTLREVSGVEEELYAHAEALLSRSAEIYDLLQMHPEYRVIVPEDECWPVGLHALGPDMPQYLFVSGDTSLLARRSVAVAGSRRISRDTAAIARTCGQRIACEGFSMVSGGAHGVDTAAHSACLSSGGCMILVPAIPAEKLLAQRPVRHALADCRLLLACDTWPQEQFSAAKALSRNHTIYALGDAALVVASRKEKGGSWRGAMDCLRAGHTPVYAVDADGPDFEGNHALFDHGARRFSLNHPMGEQLFGDGRSLLEDRID